MTVKVLVTATGSHVIADVKQVEQKDTKEVIAYWLTKPRVATYSLTEEGEVNVRFGSYCMISNEEEFSLRADHVVSILEPKPEVVERYELITNPPSENPLTPDLESYEPSTDSVEDGAVPGVPS